MTTEQSNRERFAAFYAERIIRAMRENPANWMDTPATVPDLARRMTEALAQRRALVSPQAKSAARALGIKPTVGGIADYLNAAEAAGC